MTRTRPEVSAFIHLLAGVDIQAAPSTNNKHGVVIGQTEMMLMDGIIHIWSLPGWVKTEVNLADPEWVAQLRTWC